MRPWPGRGQRGGANFKLGHYPISGSGLLFVAAFGCAHLGIGFMVFGNPFCGAGWGAP